MSRAITPTEQRSLVALRAAYTRSAARFDANRSHLTSASRAIAVSKLADLADRIERLEKKGRAK